MCVSHYGEWRRACLANGSLVEPETLAPPQPPKKWEFLGDENALIAAQKESDNG
jgi:hypothetical protein